MGRWAQYLTDSLGLKIFLGISLLLLIGVIITNIAERNRIEGGTSEEDDRIRLIRSTNRVCAGMLAGFVVSVAIAVTQFIIRFGYFSLLQEIGALTIGFAGAFTGALCGIIKRRRKRP